VTEHVERLSSRLTSGDAVVVVLGLGYVGLPVAAALAGSGLRVIGIDRLQDRVETIARGESPIGGSEPGLAELIGRTVGDGRLSATTDVGAVARADVLIVVVDTPVDPHTHQPGYASLRAALMAAAPHLRAGTLTIVESTISPGTIRKVVVPALESGSGLSATTDLLVAHCPERVMPGKLLANLRACDRVIGGWTPDAASVARLLYSRIVDGDLQCSDHLTAEIVKTAENAYRDVQIAFANELAMLCESAGADVWVVRDLVNRSPGRQVLYPGAGVGGHCIPKDPWLLVAGAEGDFTPQLIPIARAINEGMPRHVASLIARGLHDHGRGLSGSVIVVLGFAYLENSDDDRHSPSAALIELLIGAGAEVRIHDPHVRSIVNAANDPVDLAVGADALVYMVAHREYFDLNLAALKQVMRTPLIVDGRRIVDRQIGTDAGLSVLSLGVGVGGGAY